MSEESEEGWAAGDKDCEVEFDGVPYQRGDYVPYS